MDDYDDYSNYYEDENVEYEDYDEYYEDEDDNDYDYDDYDNVANESRQQGFYPPQSQMPPMPPMGQMPPMPPMGQMPPMPPMGQTPSMPPMGQPTVRPPFGQTPQFRPPFGRPEQIQRFRRCMNRMSFVTLNNGSRFWFYPTDIRRQRLSGFRWRRNRWEPYSIEISRIVRINCQ